MNAFFGKKRIGRDAIEADDGVLIYEENKKEFSEGMYLWALWRKE